jgi:hypothetical protein
MFVRKTVVIDDYIVPARKPAARPFICFEDERLESTLGEVEGGCESRHPAADDDRIVMVIHCGDYMSEAILLDEWAVFVSRIETHL